MVRLRIASIFSGCGGGDLGILGGFTYMGKFYSENKADIVFANDISKDAARIYNANFAVYADIRDIRRITSSQIPDHDILTAGFPCQPFSIQAQNPPRPGSLSDEGQLFYELVRILKTKKPLAFIAENVVGLKSVNEGRDFSLIISELRKSGYIVRHRILNSLNFGIPQKRERVFIIGFRKDLSITPPFPRKKNYKPKVVLKDVILGENEVPEKYFFSERAVKGLMESKSGKGMNRGRVQDTMSTCATVTAHLAKVSLNSIDPVLITGGRFRRFTPREVARIQSFPDEYHLEGPDTSLYRCLGNAIPPVMMWHVAKSVIVKLEDSAKKTLRSADNILA